MRAGWAAGALFFVADGGWRMADAGETGVRFRAGGSGGGVRRLAEVGIDEGWMADWCVKVL